MEKLENIYDGPNMGCMLGTAYQSLISELNKALEVAGLDVTVAEYLILRSLYSRNGMQICELSDMVGKNKGAVSRCVKGLVEKGFVTARQVSHKCLKVYVSDDGRRIEPEIMKVARERQEALDSMLSPEEKHIFFFTLQKIINNK